MYIVRESAFILSLLLNLGLYGALCAQVYLYHLAFPKDKRLNKVLVFSVFTMETVQTMLLLCNAFLFFNAGFIILPGNMEVWLAACGLQANVVLVVQTFYTYRLWILAHSWAVTILVALLAFIQFALGIINVIFLHGVLLGLAWGASGIFCDAAIVIAMAYFLLHHDNHWQNTRTHLVKLVCLVVETGTVTMLIPVMYIITSSVLQNNAGYMPVVILLGKVYSNTLMLNFNHRIQISGGRNDTQTIAIALPSRRLISNSTGAGDLILGALVEQ